MRLAELSERSGVSLATIKYYLREGLLRPGRRVSATTADYDEGHLRRLRLVRAMIQVGKVPVATVREVLRHVDDDSLGRTIRLGAALWALPQEPEPEPADEDEATVAARAEVDRLLVMLGWSTARELGALSPVHRTLVVAVATLIRLGYPWDAELMAPYAELMHQAARRDLDFVETHPSEAEKVETAVAATILFQPVLKALHRLAQEEESARRYGLS
ncbi:MerR family transcriptional regulator [Streptomyces sp. NPDC048337]|uniref:MerR family transcriptional regulator n=1 Tax=Streptomyces sp. NPDC048337 TaxID=3365535 RepID=UPI003710D510